MRICNLLFLGGQNLLASSSLFERVLDRVFLPQVKLPPLLRDDVLNKHFLGVILQKFPDEPWIPKLARNAEVFTASPQSCRLATLDSGWYAIWIEIVLLASGDRN